MQTHNNFDVIIADDGSSTAFTDGLTEIIRSSPLHITHVWHPDNGFQKNKILNAAIREASADYLIFTDADIVPRADFVSSHLKLARRARFIAGGSHVNIPESIHHDLTEGDIKQQKLFHSSWLAERDVLTLKHIWRTSFSGILAQFFDMCTPRINAFIGCNSSAFRMDICSVNGFDETLVYGSDDRDLGVRLANAGVSGRRHMFSLCCVHLDHVRPYRDETIVRYQRALLKERIRNKMRQAVRGMSDN